MAQKTSTSVDALDPRNSVKEAIIEILQSGYDTITACEEAYRVLADAHTNLKPGESIIYTTPTGERFTITKR